MLNSLPLLMVGHQECLTHQQDQWLNYLKVMLSVLGACAQFEVNMIKIRQREGIKKAKERGQHFGRKPLKPKMIKQLQNLRTGGMPVIEIVNHFKAKGIKISTSTIYKYTKG